MKPTVIALKILVAVALAWMLSMFVPMINFDIIRWTSITTLFSIFQRIISFGLFRFFQVIWSVFLTNLTGIVFRPIPAFNIGFFTQVSSMFFQEYIQNWFKLPIPLSSYSFMTDLRSLTSEIYILFFQIIAIFMIIYGVLSILGNNPKYSIRTVTFLNLMIVVPLILLGIQSMVQAFSSSFNMSHLIGLYQPDATPPKLNQLPYPLNPNIIYMAISSNFGQFLGSPIFQIALSAFIYMELSFQLNYVYQVTNPIEQRADRLKNQLEVLKRASREAVVDLERMKKEKKEKESKIVYDEQGNIIEQKKIESVRKFLSKTSTGFSYIKELIEKREVEKESIKTIEALHDTRRLSNYLNKLLVEDPEAEMTLTAKSSAPTAGRLIYSTVIDILFRVIGITVIVFFISQTPWVLTHIFRAPPAILQSVEMQNPEVILTLLIPIILLFPIISIIIRQTKASHLQQKLKEENKRRLELEKSALFTA